MVQIDYAQYKRRVYGAWIGKCIGGAAGAKQENNKDIMHYTLDNVFPNVIPPNDDFDLQVLWLKEVIRKKGPALTSDDLAEAFAKYNLCLANEYSVAIKNIELGIAPPLSGTFNNDFFKHSMGCPIRSEIWGMICAGDPEAAARYAAMDGMIDHGAESIYGEQFFAAMEACAVIENDLRTVIGRGLDFIPDDSEVAACVRSAVGLFDSGETWEDARARLVNDFGSSDASYAVINIGFTIIALLYGKGDFISTMLLAVNSGYDTDCVAATACAVLGIIEEGRSIPPELLEIIGENIMTSSVDVGSASHSIEELVCETCEAGVAFADAGLTAACFKNAPVHVLSAPEETVVTLSVSYQGWPTIGYGQTCEAVLTISNSSVCSHAGTLTIQPPPSLSVDITAIWLELAPQSKKEVLLKFSADKKLDLFPQKNIITAVFEEAGTEPVSKTFGLSGAYRMRMIGPFYDLYDTQTYDENPYREKLPRNENGHGDLYSMFNGYVDIDREYIDESFAGIENMGSMVNLHFDDLEVDRLIGYKGPCCVYLVYDFFSDEEFDAMVYIGNNQPCKVWVNGILSINDPNCRMAMIYNNCASFRVGPNCSRIVIKLARTNAPLICGMRIRNVNNRLHWATELSSIVSSGKPIQSENKMQVCEAVSIA